MSSPSSSPPTHPDDPPDPDPDPGLPPPHSMCSPPEILDRQSHMELHPFECTPSTYHLNPRLRVADPRLCVKKYRRSAAGGGARKYEGEGGRSLEQLEGTVEYLLGRLLPRQRTWGRDVMEPRTLSETVGFIDDRVRAVQVDLITMLGDGGGDGGDGAGARTIGEWVRVLRLQARLVRYGILIQYLLSDLPSKKYEAKFGWTALRTALGAYFTAWDAIEFLGGDDDDGAGEDDDGGPTERDRIERDEIRCYAALLHLSSVLRSREIALPAPPAGAGYVDENGSGVNALLAGSDAPSFAERREEEKKDGGAPESGGAGSRWMWALEVAAAADSGNCVRVFRLLCDDDEPSSSDADAATSLTEVSRWRALCRMCLLPSLNCLRLSLLRRYNKSFGKNEKVPASDLAELLRLPSPQDAIEFSKAAGLPTMASVDGGSEDRVVMKAAPICVSEEGGGGRMGRPGREEDEFVFGRNYREEWEGRAEALSEKKDDDGGGKATAKEPPKKKKDEEKEEDPTAGMSSLQLALMRMKLKDQEEDDPPPPEDVPPADDWEDREDDMFEDVEAEVSKKEEEDAAEDRDLERRVRTDGDGAAVPPGRVLRRLTR